MKYITDIDGMLAELCSELIPLHKVGSPNNDPLLILGASHTRIREIVAKYTDDVYECNTENSIVTQPFTIEELREIHDRLH